MSCCELPTVGLLFRLSDERLLLGCWGELVPELFEFEEDDDEDDEEEEEEDDDESCLIEGGGVS